MGGVQLLVCFEIVDSWLELTVVGGSLDAVYPFSRMLDHINRFGDLSAQGDGNHASIGTNLIERSIAFDAGLLQMGV